MGQVGRTFLKKVSNMATSFSNIFETHHTTVVNIIGVIVAFAAEWFVEENGFFSCPCTKELAKSYGLSFLLGGSVIFWMIGLLVHTHTWRACHGCNCCFPCGHQMCLLKSKYFFSTCLHTLVFPISWAFALLIDGDYMACILSELCDENNAEYDMFKKMSQEWAVWGLGILLVTVVVLRSLCRCFNKANYLQFTLSETYRKEEDEIIFKRIPETAKTLASEVVNTFYGLEDTKKDWDAATDENQDLGVYLSPMHKFVRGKKPATGQPILEQPPNSTNDGQEALEKVVIHDDKQNDS